MCGRAQVFVLFMTQGIFQQPFVRLEIEEALAHGKPVICLHETDERHGRFDFDAATGVPTEFQPVVRRLLAEVESVGWERRGFKQEAVLDELKKRFYASLAGERR